MLLARLELKVKGRFPKSGDRLTGSYIEPCKSLASGYQNFAWLRRLSMCFGSRKITIVGGLSIPFGARTADVWSNVWLGSSLRLGYTLPLVDLLPLMARGLRDNE